MLLSRSRTGFLVSDGVCGMCSARRTPASLSASVCTKPSMLDDAQYRHTPAGTCDATGTITKASVRKIRVMYCAVVDGPAATGAVAADPPARAACVC